MLHPIWRTDFCKTFSRIINLLDRAWIGRGVLSGVCRGISARKTISNIFILCKNFRAWLKSVMKHRTRSDLTRPRLQPGRASGGQVWPLPSWVFYFHIWIPELGPARASPKFLHRRLKFYSELCRNFAVALIWAR